MAFIYYPFEKGQGKDVSELQWGKMARLWRGDGVVPRNGLYLDEGYDNDDFYVDYGTGLDVNVSKGIAWIQGYYFESDATTNIPLAAADPTNPRIDLIVIRLDWAQNQITIEAITGTPASTPIAPTPTQSFGQTWEIPIAEVLVNAGETSPTNIIDRRPISHHAGVKPACILGAFTSTTIPEDNQVKLVWDVCTVDTTGTMWDFSEDEIIIPEDGIYLVFFNVGFDANETSHIEGILRLRQASDSTEHDLGRSNEQGINVGHEYSGVSVVRKLKKGDRVFVLGEQSDDGDATAEPATVIVSDYQPTFGAIKIAEGDI